MARHLVARDVVGGEIEVAVDELPASNDGLLLVQVSDGLNSSTAVEARPAASARVD